MPSNQSTKALNDTNNEVLEGLASIVIIFVVFYETIREIIDRNYFYHIDLKAPLLQEFYKASQLSKFVKCI
jgi:hypothetical protein